MNLFRRIKQWMLLHCPRYRLRRICKATGIKPYWWQKEFAFGTFHYIPPEISELRGVGNTTAVMLRILMIPQSNETVYSELERILRCDPGWQKQHIRWYSVEYRRLAQLCLVSDIPVLQVDISRMMDKMSRGGRREGE